MTRSRRRATAKAGLALDILAAIALAASAFIGEIPARSVILPAVTLAIGITIGTGYLYSTRPRPRPRLFPLPPRPQVNRCPYDSCHHNHEEGSQS
jgi:hypothetical protein